MVLRVFVLVKGDEWVESWDAQDAALLMRRGWTLTQCSRTSLEAVRAAEAELQREDDAKHG